MAGTVRRRSRPWDPEKSLTVGLRATAERGRQIAFELTSGTTDKATLKAMGYPFGRGFARGKRKGAQRGSLPKLPINRQTGQLQNSIRVFQRTKNGGPCFQIQFTSPHVIVLSPGGLPNMVARGFWTAFRARMKPIMEQEMRKAFSR